MLHCTEMFKLLMSIVLNNNLFDVRNEIGLIISNYRERSYQELCPVNEPALEHLTDPHTAQRVSIPVHI